MYSCFLMFSPIQAPGYIFYKFWTLLIWPWFTAGSPDTSEGKEGKKQKQKQKHRKVYVR